MRNEFAGGFEVLSRVTIATEEITVVHRIFSNQTTAHCRNLECPHYVVVPIYAPDKAGHRSGIANHQA